MKLFFILNIFFVLKSLAQERVLIISTNPEGTPYKYTDFSSIFYTRFDASQKTSLNGFNDFTIWKSSYKASTYPRVNGDYFYYLEEYPANSNNSVLPYTLNRINLLTNREDIYLKNIPCDYKNPCNNFGNFRIETNNGVNYLQIVRAGPNSEYLYLQIKMSSLNDTENDFSIINWELTLDFVFFPFVSNGLDFLIRNNYTKYNSITNKTEINNSNFVLSLRSGGISFIPSSSGSFKSTKDFSLNWFLPDNPFPDIVKSYSKIPQTANGATFYVFPNNNSWIMYVFNPLSTNLTSTYGKANIFCENFTIPGISYPTWIIDALEIDPELTNSFYVIAKRPPYPEQKIIQLVFEYDGEWVDGSPTLLPNSLSTKLLYTRLITNLTIVSGNPTSLNVIKSYSLFQKNSDGIFYSTNLSTTTTTKNIPITTGTFQTTINTTTSSSSSYSYSPSFIYLYFSSKFFIILNICLIFFILG